MSEKGWVGSFNVLKIIFLEVIGTKVFLPAIHSQLF
jgi:hypothetical protein